MKFIMLSLLTKANRYNLNIMKRFIMQACTDSHVELSNSIKKEIENHWRCCTTNGNFNPHSGKNKFYVLAMFPYPSGNLHMGHVRVYTISDTMARFYRMNGKNVFHPIGWDSFGLPAENAALSRNINPEDWTNLNINEMKQELMSLGYSFDWQHEFATSDEQYFRWTQKLFLLLYKEGLVYQKEALVNWDPVDQTVLADEQVDNNGNSWRSGAKVEKKFLKQWFIRTTKFAKDLLQGLSDPSLEEWRDIIKLQRHWIGDCNGYSFDMKLIENECNIEKISNYIRLWTSNPEALMDSGAFIITKSKGYLNKLQYDTKKLKIVNPFTQKLMRILIHDDYEYPEFCDFAIIAPRYSSDDALLTENLGFKELCVNPFNNLNNNEQTINRNRVIELARELNIGGYPVSSKLQDWLISRQRRWGTPIPIVHCTDCGAVPLEEKSLPVHVRTNDNNDYVPCPKCGNKNAKSETDTMDTFVDSSWYFLRFLDSQNSNELFNIKLAKNFMPVDLYIGGKEHAVLHLYYARFVNHFLHSCGLSPQPEPFKRLLVQGMVMGRSYRIKGTGKYIREDEVKIVDKKKNKAVEIATGKDVVITWEKMSKSKLNGVNPSDMISTYGCDTTRLIILADVAPTSHRNWSNATFPGIINWQRRLWLTVNEFSELRNSLQLLNLPEREILEIEEAKMFDARNYYVKGATFNYRHSHQLSVAISKMQGLTNSIRSCQKQLIPFLKEYERALSVQLIMLAPMAPHFASELWSKFVSAPHRLNSDSKEITWNKDVLQQQWPDVDQNYELDLNFIVNGHDQSSIKMPRNKLDKLSHEKAMDIALRTDSVMDCIKSRAIKKSSFELYPGCEARLNLFLEIGQKNHL